MNMSTEIRVRTGQRYRRLYNDLKNLAVGDMHELFFLCACIGYKNKKIKPLGKDKEDRFWSKTFSPEEWACFYSMMLEENNMDLHAIQDDKKVIERMEEYANAGMEILLDEFLSDYLAKSNSEPRLDISHSKELPKTILYFIREQIL